MSANLKHFVAVPAIVLSIAAGASAQTPRPDDAEQVRARQRISTMEAVLAVAVQNGADNVLRQVSSVMQDRPMLSGVPQVRGVRLEGYGVFFQVQVPTLVLPITWPIRQMVQESETRAASETLKRMFAAVSTLEGRQAEVLNQLIRDLQLQLDGSQRPRSGPRGVSAANLVGLQGPVASQAQAPSVDQRVVDDPHAAYTEEVKAALISAMLENSQGLAIGPAEWLTIAARDDEPRNPLLVGNTIDFSTWIIRVKGSDLAALRAGTITLEEARARVERREE